MRNFDCLIIGAGSAGLFCASRLCFLRKSYKKPLKIAIVDSNSRVGRKLAITGNGRCNLTNLDLDSSLFNSDDESKVRDIINSFDVNETLEFFTRELGLLVTNKDELVYPLTNKSSSVIDSLRFFLEENGVEFILDSKVTKINRNDELFQINISDEVIETKNLIIATGGASYASTGSDGSGYKLLSSLVSRSCFTNVRPVLVQLISSDTDISLLSGSRFNCDVTLFEDNKELHSESGEILFTDNGISGICVMQLSRFIRNHKYHVIVDLLPQYTIEFVQEYLKNCLENFGFRTVTEALCGITIKCMAEVVSRRCGIEPNQTMESLTSSQLLKIANCFKSFRVQISGTEGFDKAQVTSGGLNLSSMDSNLQVNSVSGLFVCGEVLNVDGPCGGYNLQWAWSSADAVANGLIRRIYGI